MADPVHGERLLPQVLDELAISQPNRLYATIPNFEKDLCQGFRDVTTKDMADCVDVLAHWLEMFVGRGSGCETICYLGVPDLRGAMMFLAAVKCGYKVLFPSPKNPPATIISLLDQTSCSKVLFCEELARIIGQLREMSPDLKVLQIASMDSIFASQAQRYPYDEDFGRVKSDPIVVLHSSGSTGSPKPITMTHGTFSILDSERNLPCVSGRQNIDNSIWDFPDGGGKFYTPFPFFHLSGFLSTVVNPIFTESSSPVLGPASAPPSPAILKEIMKHQKLRAIYIPPALAEALLHEPEAIELFKDLDFVAYTGGPFSQKAGETLSAVTTLRPFYGSTEAFQVPQLAPLDPRADFAYMEWNPCFKLEMQPSDDEPDAFELVLFANESTQKMSALNHNVPGVKEWRTKDLFKRHPDPKKDKLWTYFGRRDDIIVLSTGMKFNPVPMELRVQGHPMVAGAIIVGRGRPKAALLLEPKDWDEDPEALVREIRSLIIEANRMVELEYAAVDPELGMIARPEKPFIRAGKGTVVRGLTEKAYADEIAKMYDSK